MLSLAIAAIVAAWLPFSVFYMNALNKRAAPISLVSRPHSGSGTVRVITTTSGATRLVAANGPTPVANGAALASVAPTSVTTRAS
jgi:hypothetical protein